MDANLLYIQKVQVHKGMAEMYQQFLLKLVTAYNNLDLEKPWKVYENVFGKIEEYREFIFIRTLVNWADLDDIAKEKGLSKIMADNYGEQEAIQWMNIVQKSIKSIETQVISELEQF